MKCLQFVFFPQNKWIQRAHKKLCFKTHLHGFTHFFLSALQQVEAILVNIFGGIVNCAIIANGITKACRELALKVPLVVRLEGEHTILTRSHAQNKHNTDQWCHIRLTESVCPSSV